jgi:hypothetical protein
MKEQKNTFNNNSLFKLVGSPAGVYSGVELYLSSVRKAATPANLVTHLHSVKADLWSIGHLQNQYSIYSNGASAEVRSFRLLVLQGAVIGIQ